MKEKNLVLFFENFTNEHFGKDPFLVPYYLGKRLGYKVTILYPDLPINKNLPSEMKGVSLVRLNISKGNNFRLKYFALYRYIWKHAKSIDVFMRFFDIGVNRELSLIYKLRNPHGKFYIKMDINPDLISDGSEIPFFRRIKDKLLYGITNYTVDVVSCETQIAYKKLKSKKNSEYKQYERLVVMPNGFDEDLVRSFDIIEKGYEGKDNIMITVGRLGTYPKNTEMLLRALTNVNLNDWKFYLIGPIDDTFRPQMEAFFEKYPEKRDNIIFTGLIYDKKELWDYYNRAKVFVFTSEWESFGLVLVEAKRFRNYILTTPVGAAYDVLENGHYGEIVANNDDNDLAGKLQEIVDGNTNLDVYDNFDPMSLSYESILKVVADRLN